MFKTRISGTGSNSVLAILLMPTNKATTKEYLDFEHAVDSSRTINTRYPRARAQSCPRFPLPRVMPGDAIPSVPACP
jgi:hypothetical protein